MIDGKIIKEMFNSGGGFLCGDYAITVGMDGWDFMDCYVSILNTDTKEEHKIYFKECAKKVTDIFTKKFCESIAEKLNVLLK